MMKMLRHILLSVVMLLLAECMWVTLRAEAAYPISNDPMRVKQAYLDQIHIDAAWSAAPESNIPVLVAVVDTGVDLTHPDLVNRMAEGINLIKPNEKPFDDNGHGTNVAGIIAASINNDKGIAGIAPNARIMPIKALESDGTGGETKLAEGIRYAVDHGAKIVVLSLGLNKYSDNLAETVQYAEKQGVLLVAAAGNEGTSVKYPAAFHTVLAVGGSTPDKHADYRSNYGPEIDLVAPWDVFTTKLGGGYEYKDGSSMSAPQVAGVAALLWSKYPTYTPSQIRNLLLQSAEDLDTRGWDANTGYGLLRADLAMAQTLSEDRFEPNNQRDQAKKVSVQALLQAQLSSPQDQDWFALESPYDGTVDLTVRSADGTEISLRTDKGSADSMAYYTVGSEQPLSLQVKKGITYLQLQTVDRKRKTPLSYTLQTDFHIYKDPYEDNDKQFKAFVLPERSQTIKGTFHQANDQDWFLLPIEHSGTLRLKCTVDTGRIDPVILYQKKGEKSVTIDQAGDGSIEVSALIDVLPGEYYIRISNMYAQAVTGEYTLSIEYSPKLIDPNEPNDKPYQATFVGLFSEYEGVFSKDSDVDWFEFRITQESLAQIAIANIPENQTLFASLYDSNMKEKASVNNKLGQSTITVEQALQAGTYFLKLQANPSFNYQMYKLQIGANPLFSGYIDVGKHWAAEAITELTRKEIVKGYGNYRFAPDSSITRAEAAVMLVRALKLSKQKSLRYADLDDSHWAYSSIAKAEQAGLIEGYPDRTFGPNRPLTRMEMTNMLARSLNMVGKLRGNSPFDDVANDYWGVGILKQMWADGWISGFPDGAFRPDQEATRAEFATLLNKVLNRDH